jgi:hypothetical protein
LTFYLNPELETRNPKLEIRNPKPEDPKPETRNPKTSTFNPNLKHPLAPTAIEQTWHTQYSPGQTLALA